MGLATILRYEYMKNVVLYTHTHIKVLSTNQ